FVAALSRALKARRVDQQLGFDGTIPTVTATSSIEEIKEVQRQQLRILERRKHYSPNFWISNVGLEDSSQPDNPQNGFSPMSIMLLRQAGFMPYRNPQQIASLFDSDP